MSECNKQQQQEEEESHDKVDPAEALLDRYPVQDHEIQKILQMQQQWSEDHFCDTYHLNAKPDVIALFSSVLQDTCPVGIHEEDALLYEQAKFTEAAVLLLGRRGENAILNAFWKALLMLPPNNNNSGDMADNSMQQKNAHDILSCVYRFSSACYYLVSLPEQPSKANTTCDASTTVTTTTGEQELPASWKRTAQSSLMTTTTVWTKSMWEDWMARYAPNFASVIATVYHYTLLGHDYIPKPVAMSFVQTNLPSRFCKNDNKMNVLLQLSLQNVSGSVWKRLYCSDEDGCSFAALQQALLGYAGPTVLLIQTDDPEKHQFGYYSEVPWKSSPKWYTSCDPSGDMSFLFSLRPHWRVYRRMQHGHSSSVASPPPKCHQYLHWAPSFRQQELVGLAVGGASADRPRLHITQTFEGCRASSIDTVFENGPLLSDDGNPFFNIDMVELWAVCSDNEGFRKSFASGQLQAEVREGARQKAAQVDRRAFVEDFTSGAYMNNLFIHREQTRGRTSFVAEDDGKGYYIEGKEPSERNLSVERN